MMFDDALDFGAIGESKIAMWLNSHGFNVLPVYEKEIDTGKGPRLFMVDGKLIAPDMFVFNHEKSFWVEAKRKTGFSWYRKKREWQTGIDITHYLDYCRVNDETPYPVWLIFWQGGGSVKGSGASPRGLYGNNIDYLRRCESHRFNHMVYWGIDNLKKIGNIEPT